VFGRLLDPSAGHWALRPAGDVNATRSYLDETLVLRTVFRTAEGTASVTDALLLDPEAHGHEVGRRSPHILLRRVEASRAQCG
jgi:hypothetical protein